MDLEYQFGSESAVDLPPAETAGGDLPQWVRENLEQGPGQTELPSWVLENLEKTAAHIEPAAEGSEQTDRQLESQQTAGGILRELFCRITGLDEKAESPEERYDLKEATEGWHVQEEPYSCANACQEFIIDEFLDTDVQEADLNALARENNWLQEEGTMLDDIGNLLEAYGIETHRQMGADFDDVKAALDRGDRVIVGVYNAALDDSWCGLFPVTTANHAVEVIGVDDSDPDNIKVIVNDPGVEDGCGKVVSLETFNEARSGSGGFMVVAERP